MRTILLLSGDPSLEETIRSVLPETGVEPVTDRNSLLAALEARSQGGGVGMVVVDARTDADVFAWLEEICRKGVPVVVVIPAVELRTQVFGAGASDYLIDPLLPEEVKLRLGGVGQTPASLDQVGLNERLITLGRLTSSFCHEINNIMQGAHGSISLVLEEQGLSEDMQVLLSIGTDEMRRVTRLVERLRQFYRPDIDQVGSLSLEELLREALTFAADELSRFEVQVETEIPPQQITVNGQVGQLHYAFLSLLLNLTALVGSHGGGEIHIRAIPVGADVRVIFTTRTRLPLGTGPMAGAQLEASLGISTVRQIISAHGGSVHLRMEEQGLVGELFLPTETQSG